MTGKKQTLDAPAWFKPRTYLHAYELDAGDWLLNLTLRRWLHDEPNPRTEAALRHAGPVLQRNNEAQIRAMHLEDCHSWVASFDSDVWDDPDGACDEARTRPSLPGDVRDALRKGSVRSGVWPLSVQDLYLAERKLPDDVRKAAATCTPDDPPGFHPRAFYGTVDDAFGVGPATQRIARILRVDLARPDDVLHADLHRYLVAERHRLAQMGGEQPYREAARLKLKPHRNSLQTLAADGLLPFLDLDRWQRAEGKKLSFYALREMAEIDKSREAGLRERVKLALNQMRLHAWFARLERSVKLTHRARQSKK